MLTATTMIIASGRRASALEERVSMDGKIERKFRIMNPLQVQKTLSCPFPKASKKGERRKEGKIKGTDGGSP